MNRTDTNDIKILVAAHKSCWMPKEEIYIPLHVGAAGKEPLIFQNERKGLRDDTGDNISAKNPNYCELTGLYWAWKNLNCDYIGLCHYRRYFSHHFHPIDPEKRKNAILHRIDYEKLLAKYDIILPKPMHCHGTTIEKHYKQEHNIKDLEETSRIISEKYPNYSNAFSAVMNRNYFYGMNMFVMKKTQFDRYCTWLFDILFTLESRIDISSYDTYQARVFGFLAERLFNVWLEKENLSTCDVSVINLEKKKPKFITTINKLFFKTF
jgi:hypothetical protein